MAEMYGKTTGCSRGRGGSMHLFDVSRRFYGGNAIVGGGLPLAIGVALADRMRGEDRVTACFFGDGAVAEGEFHECMNLAALWDLPVLFCCENNLYAMGTAVERAQAQTDLAVRAGSYGMPAWPVDGMDVIAVEHAARRAAEAVRAGGGPHFLELRTYRFRAHSLYDPELYRDKAEVERWRQRDPIELLARRMREAGELDDDGTRRDRGHARPPDRGIGRDGAGGPGRAGRGPHHVRLQPGVIMSTAEPVKTSYREAMRAAIREAMQRDDRVFLMGEDVGRYGGCFAVSLGLLEEFGPERIRDTPLSESAFVGAGIGAAMAGMRPIVEIMTVNFSLLALDQILNNAATLLHMSGGQCNVPLVIRMTTGAGRQVAAQHSHSLEGWYAHIPGIRVLAPATIEDARGMLWPALQDPDPVLIFEHGSLYNLQGVLAADAGPVDIRSAMIRRPGRDVSLITYGGTLPKALAAAGAARRGWHRRGGHRPALAASAGRRDGHGVGGEDPPGRDHRRGLAVRQPVRRGQRADHRAGLLRSRRAGRTGLLGRGADALPAAPGGGRAPAAGADRRGGARGGGLTWPSSACPRSAPTWTRAPCWNGWSNPATRCTRGTSSR